MLNQQKKKIEPLFPLDTSTTFWTMDHHPQCTKWMMNSCWIMAEFVVGWPGKQKKTMIGSAFLYLEALSSLKGLTSNYRPNCSDGTTWDATYERRWLYSAKAVISLGCCFASKKPTIPTRSVWCSKTTIVKKNVCLPDVFESLRSNLVDKRNKEQDNNDDVFQA